MSEQQAAVQSFPLPARGKKKHWLAWLLVLLVCGALLLPLLHKSKTADTAGFPGGSAAGTMVTAATVQSGGMDIYLDALGTVTPQATINVYGQVSGRVLSVNYREGQIVTKGQVLAEIDPEPTKAQLRQSMGSLMRDRATLEQAKTNLHRYQEALKEKAVAEQTVFDEQATVRQTEGTVENDEGSVQYYKVQLSYCHIVAPITGRIGLRLIDKGNILFSGSSTTVATITQIDPITVVFSLAEDHVPQLQQRLASAGGLKVDVYDRAQAVKLTTGKLLTFDNQIDTTTGTVKLRALFSNTQGKLFPNQFVNARLQVNTLQNGKLIPTSAIQYNGQQAFVYLIKADNTAALTNITVTNSEQSSSAIEGLSVGQNIVTSNFDRLQDGAKVMVPGAAKAPSTTALVPAR